MNSFKDWLAEYPELEVACKILPLTALMDYNKMCYKPLTYVEQHGPQCGLVALAMCCESPSTDLVKSLYKLAKRKSYTKYGEIFSASNMANLAKEVLPNKINVKLYSGSLETKHIKKRLFNGDILLVPYDDDSAKGPCLKKGHKAHWAVISGAIETDQHVYVFVRHGGIEDVAMWKLADLALSNAQLFEISPENCRYNFILPETGIAGSLGLKRKAVILSSNKLVN